MSVDICKLDGQDAKAHPSRVSQERNVTSICFFFFFVRHMTLQISVNVYWLSRSFLCLPLTVTVVRYSFTVQLLPPILLQSSGRFFALPKDMGILETYRYLMAHAADPRVVEWPLMSSPFPMLGILLSYVVIVLYLGPAYMKNRKPYNLKNLMICYNFVLVIWTAAIFYAILSSSINMKYSLRCQPHVVSHDPESYRMAKYLWWLVVLKIFEFGDTFIFVLRKKYKQASFLHIYHHTTTAALAWAVCKFAPGGIWTFPILPNSVVHVFMYTYYLLSSLGPEMQKRVTPWKRYITRLQMIQFVIMLIQMSQTLLPSCEPDRKPLAYAIFIQVSSLFLLFCDFYNTSYLKKKVK